MLKKIRNILLKKREVYICQLIIDLFEEPKLEKSSFILSNIQDDCVRNEIHEVFKWLIDFYNKDKGAYYDQIIYGERIIWSEIVNCFQKVIAINEIVKYKRAVVYEEDYITACEQIESLISFYAKSQAYLSNLESVLGVDRYLDKVSQSDFEILDELLINQKKKIEELSKNYKKIFQTKWKLTNISSIIFHKLIKYNGENQICTSIVSGQKRVLLFIIDGLGYSQYLWNNELECDKINFTYRENIFSWLKKEKCMKELVLGSSYVSDTSAGLAEMFLGHEARKTGIIGSKFFENGKTKLSETKKIANVDFQRVFNTEYNSITDIVKSTGLNSKVFYCSRYASEELGFSKAIFNGAKVESIIPAERVFTVLMDYLDNEDSSGLNVVYITNIDNVGHTMGAYSKFEKYEHDKLNCLFKNYLIDLALYKPEIFDGLTSIMLVADHGMAESSKKTINRYEIASQLSKICIENVKIVENNRTLFLYNITYENQIISKNVLIEYFESLKVDVDILCKFEDEYLNYFSVDSSNRISSISPDIIIRLIDNSIFYTNKSLNPHLVHYGGHGGASFGEVFVPLLDIVLNQSLLESINKRFINIM